METKCDICGKTLKERQSEGYNFDEHPKMEFKGEIWSSNVCPVCIDIIDDIVIDYFSDKAYIQDIFNECLAKAKFRVTVKGVQE